MILIPSYDDWESLGLLLPRLDRESGGRVERWRVLVVDDGSNEPATEAVRRFRPDGLGPVEVLELRGNLGHQRAIAVGLCYVVERMPEVSAIVVMDADGEDAAEDVPRLLDRMRDDGGRVCVFAERTRRSEDPLFRIGYLAYRALHRLLTGIAVRIGNFSAIPRIQAERLVRVSDLWNHFAASAVKAKVPMERVPTRRARRLAGHSRMNYGGLIAHGLSAMSVFSDRVAVRLLVMSAVLGLGVVGALIAVICVRMFTSWAVPGWATMVAGFLVLLLAQIALVNLVFVFVVLSGRGVMSFLPIRDYGHFVGRVYELCPGATRPGTGTDMSGTSLTSLP